MNVAQPLPSLVHFFWMGQRLPFMYRMALLSAVRHANVRYVQLHHTDAFADDTAAWAAEHGVAMRRCDLGALLTEVSGPALAQLAARVASPVALSNMFRAAIIVRDGGIYMDMDTVTVRSLAGLCSEGKAFIGEEHIVFTDEVMTSRNPLVWTAAGLRTGVRDVLRRLPKGHLWFDAVAPFYPCAVNGAILGGPPGCTWLSAYLDAMLAVPETRITKPHALGTHLLQRVTKVHGGDITLHPPAVFYPLAPEISERWFRMRRHVGHEDLARVIKPQTLVVHWYASVRTKSLVPQVTPSYVHAHANRQLYSHLVAGSLAGAT